MRRDRPEGKGHARPDTRKHRVILTERSEVDSESRRKPAVSIARAAASLDTQSRLYCRRRPEHRRPPDFWGNGGAVLLAGRELTAIGGRAQDKEAPLAAPEVARGFVADAGHTCGRLAADPFPGRPQIAAILRANAANLRAAKLLQLGESRGLSHPLQPVETAGIEPASAIA